MRKKPKRLSKVNRYELLLYLWDNRLRGDYMHINMKQVAELLDMDWVYVKKIFGQMAKAGMVIPGGQGVGKKTKLVDPDKFIWYDMDHNGMPILEDDDE